MHARATHLLVMAVEVLAGVSVQEPHWLSALPIATPVDLDLPVVA